MRRVDGERREHGEDAVVELERELGASVVVEVAPVDELDAGLLQRRRDFFREHGSLERDELVDPRPDRAQLLGLVDAVGRGGPHAGRELILETRHADLEELVEVRAEDREELGAFE